MMIILSVLRVLGRGEGFKGVSRALGVFWMFLSRIAFGLFEAFLAEYVDSNISFHKLQGKNRDVVIIIILLVFFFN